MREEKQLETEFEAAGGVRFSEDDIEKEYRRLREKWMKAEGGKDGSGAGDSRVG